tara:strand:- start:1810 stop:2190 length:381 start_codon:yes stop_codon:yes gene_type:complete
MSLGTPQVKVIPKAGALELLLWFCRRRIRFQVAGSSMSPVLMPDDEVLISPRAPVAPGDIVVLQHPFRKDVTLIKGLKQIDDAGQLLVQGLNADESTDSRSFGAVPRRLLLGKATSWVFRGKEREA